MITLLTVTYNNLIGLKYTYQSVCAQSSSGFKWLIIDGASNDGTLEYVKKVQGESDVDIEIYSCPDDGLYDAMNIGLNYCASEDYVIFLNAGDSLAGDKTIEKISDSIARYPDTVLFFGRSIRFSRDGRTYVKKPRSIKHLPYGMVCEHQAAIFKVANVKEIKYDLRYSLSADYDLFVKLIKCTPLALLKELDLDVCKFEFGGISYQRREEAIFEDMLVRFRNYNIGWLPNLALGLAHYFSHKLKVIMGSVR